MSAKEKLAECRRAAAKARKFRDIEWNGVAVRVVMPMLGDALKLNEEDGVLLGIRACVVDPESGERIFGALSVEEVGREADDVLAGLVVEALNGMREAVEGNSGSTISDG